MRNKALQLFEERGETSRFIVAEIRENGNVVLMGQDVGKAPREWWGDDDYEFWVTVRAEHKDELILALLAALYSGDRSAVDNFRALLTERGVPHKFENWA